jgi:hypothetical protein
MKAGQHDREPRVGARRRATRRLGPYLAAAAGIHAAVFALSAHRSAKAAPEAQASTFDATNVDVEPQPQPPQTPPGGGSPIPGEARVATTRPPLPVARPKPKAVALDPAPPTEPTETARVQPDPLADPSATSDDTVPAMAAQQASDDRRQRDMAMAAAAAAAGIGPGAGGGPGGSGAGWGAPAIRGRNAFGNGSGGALVGRVCFIPVGKTRISDVLDTECRYVATVYADTLDIPERLFYDGFPGVSNRSDWFLIDYTGVFKVTSYGTYVFRLHSDDGSYLFIDDALVIENDGKHAPESRSGRVQLGVGEHRIKVRYAQTTDRMALQLFVRVPQSSGEIIFRTQL